jgi:hypothetical protein
MRRGSGAGRGRRRAALTVGAVFLLATVTGCAPAQPGVELLPEGTPGVTGTTDPTRPRPGDYSDIDFKGQVVSFQAFLVKLLTGTFPEPARASARRTLVVAAEVTNTGESPNYFYGNFGVEDDTSQLGYGGATDTELKVLPGATVTAQIEITLDRPIDRTRTALVMGKPSEAQVRVPLGGVEPVVARLPVDQPLPPVLKAGGVRFTPTAMTVRYSLPRGFGDLPPQGRAYLAVRVRTEGSRGFEYVRLEKDAVQLTLPAGATVPAADLSGVLEGEHQLETWLVFAVPEPYGGRYHLAVSATEPAALSGAIDFDVVGPPPAPGVPSAPPTTTR